MPSRFAWRVRLLDIDTAGAFQVRLLAFTPGHGALSRLVPRTRALALAFPYLIQAGRSILSSLVCCRPVWQLDLACLFGRNGAFFVLPHATFTLRTLHSAS